MMLDENPQFQSDLAKSLKKDIDFSSLPHINLYNQYCIGWDRDIKTVGINETEGDFLLKNDIEKMTKDFFKSCQPWIEGIDYIRQVAIGNLYFGLGKDKFLLMQDFITKLAIGKYKDAADILLESDTFNKVRVRGRRLAAIIETGLDQ